MSWFENEILQLFETHIKDFISTMLTWLSHIFGEGWLVRPLIRYHTDGSNGL